MSTSSVSASSQPIVLTSAFELDFVNGKRPKDEAAKLIAAFLPGLPVLQASEYSGDVVLISGANKGIGYEAAKVLGSKGLKVLLGCRDAERGKAAEKQLQDENKSGSFHFVELDVTSEQSIAAAVEHISKVHGHLDVLINNAGIIADFNPPSEADSGRIRKVFETNVFGVMLLTKAFLPLLQKSSHPRVVNVSSGMGCLSAMTQPTGSYSQMNVNSYCSSKAALNMSTLLLANEMRSKHPNMRVNAIDPGYTATDLNGNSGPQTQLEGTEAMVTASLLNSQGPSGTIFNRYGYLAW